MSTPSVTEAVKARLVELRAALDKLKPHGIRRAELGANVDPPAVVLGPPQLTWDAYVSVPTSARLVVYLSVALDDRSMDKLLDLLPLVTEAIESVKDCVVTLATPTAYTAGNSDLPAYEITVEVAL